VVWTISPHKSKPLVLDFFERNSRKRATDALSLAAVEKPDCGRAAGIAGVLRDTMRGGAIQK
jgi:hypothetical protein